jgi:hypothetical protein
MPYLLWKKVKEYSQAITVDDKLIIHLRVGVNKATRNLEILMK